MMNINEIVNSFANKLKQDKYFENIKIIKPYPDTFYAGEIKNSIVCVGLDEVEILPLEIGDDSKYASIKIKTDIFVTKNKSKTAWDIFLNICRVFQELNVVGVKLQPLAYSKSVKGYELGGCFTVNTNVEFGGESGE